MIILISSYSQLKPSKLIEFRKCRVRNFHAVAQVQAFLRDVGQTRKRIVADPCDAVADHNCFDIKFCPGSIISRSEVFDGTVTENSQGLVRCIIHIGHFRAVRSYAAGTHGGVRNSSEIGTRGCTQQRIRIRICLHMHCVVRVVCQIVCIALRELGHIRIQNVDILRLIAAEPETDRLDICTHINFCANISGTNQCPADRGDAVRNPDGYLINRPVSTSNVIKQISADGGNSVRKDDFFNIFGISAGFIYIVRIKLCSIRLVPRECRIIAFVVRHTRNIGILRL